MRDAYIVWIRGTYTISLDRRKYIEVCNTSREKAGYDIDPAVQM
jgi:hypothetical protein